VSSEIQCEVTESQSSSVTVETRPCTGWVGCNC